MKYRIVGIGELLWDLLPGGRQLGGAPANFAYHSWALGADSRLISRLGNDALGHEALDRLRHLGMPVDCLEVDPQLPTGTVTVKVAADGQPHFQIHENVAWDALQGDIAGRQAVARADVVCFGTLAQRSEPSRSTIQSLVAASPATALRILDVNLRQHYHSPAVIERSLALANVLKINDTELPRLAAMFQLDGDERRQMESLARRFDLRGIAYTRGGSGSVLYADGNWSVHPGTAATVVDTVGAGDSFTAALALGLLAGWDLDRVNDQANRLAAFVCSQSGATPELPAEFRSAFNPEATPPQVSPEARNPASR